MCWNGYALHYSLKLLARLSRYTVHIPSHKDNKMFQVSSFDLFIFLLDDLTQEESGEKLAVLPQGP